MNVHSFLATMSQPQLEPSPTIAASKSSMLPWFVSPKRGFHQTSMHDISAAKPGISVGLIYRYFANKEAVISAMADRHKNEIQRSSWNAPGKRPPLLDRSKYCSPRIAAKIRRTVIGLRGRSLCRASRNPQVADLVRDVLQTSMDGVTDLIARSPEGKCGGGLAPDELSERILQSLAEC